MSETENRLKQIHEKLQLLLKQHSVLQKENRLLKDEVEQLRRQSGEYQEGMEALRQQMDVLKFTSGDMSAEEKKQFEKRINNYIKEIDRCISLLSE